MFFSQVGRRHSILKEELVNGYKNFNRTNRKITGQLLVGPNALWPTQPKLWVGHVGHGPPGPRCSAPHKYALQIYIKHKHKLST